MKEQLLIQHEIEFNAPQEKVWDLLTHPSMTKQYMFGCELLSDWQTGSTVDWKGKTEDGQEMIYVTGKVLEYDEGEKVSITMIDPNMGIADIPENYLHLTYELTPTAGGTMVSLTQGGFDGAEQGQSRYEESVKGWEVLIPVMKKLVEGE